MIDINKNSFKMLDPEDVCTDRDALVAYSSDASFEHGRMPVAIVRPRTSQEIESLVKWAGETKTPLVTVSSAAPHHKGSTIPSTEGTVIVDMSGMKKILSVNRQQRMAVVEAGVTYEELLPVLEENDLTIAMPLAPKAGKSVLASVTEIEPRLNCIRQWNYVEPLRCMDVTWGDGYRMFTGDASGGPLDIELQQSKQKWQLDAPGPMMIDYYRLMVGSRGTMGIAAWVSVRCEILPKMHEMYFVAGKDPSKVVDFIYKVIHPRFSDELFLINKGTFLALTGELCTDADAVPEWIAPVGIAGRDCAYRLRVEGQALDIADIAKSCGLTLDSSLAGVSGDAMLKIASSPCKPGSYWKTAKYGASADIFFMTTLDKVPDFTEKMFKLAKDADYPLSDICIYAQPTHQGASCHCEFVLPYAPENKNKTEALFDKASTEFSDMGAYFSRTYGKWAKLQLSKDAVTEKLIRQVKCVFDPNGIMNPGKI